MKFLRSGWMTIVLAIAACSSTAYYADPLPPDDDDGRQTVIVPGELPPQTFSPRPHEPRAIPRPVAASFDAVPSVQKGGRCVPAGAVPEGKPGGTSTRSRGIAKRSSSSSSQGKDAGKVRYRPSAPKSAPAAGADDDERSSAPPSEPAGAAPEPEPPPMADASDEAPTDAVIAESKPSATERRERRRQRRRAKRETGPLAPAAPGGSEVQSTAEHVEPEVIVEEPELPPPEQGWGQATYLSNDDSMSLSSAQRVIFAIEETLPLPAEHIRRHELLNYFSFEQTRADRGHDFAVHPQIAPSQIEPGLHTLALGVSSRPVGRAGRRNAVVTLVVDRSGSMGQEGRMDFLKRGLLRMVRELKDGDIVHLVTFDHRVCVPLQNFMVGRDDPTTLTRAIHALRPSGRTNLHAGLTKGYTLADATYQPKYTNRVIVITDALANTGVTDPKTMSLVTDFYDQRRIRLTGIGVGREFNDALLDDLTEKGRGAYVFLGSQAEVDAVFGDHFTSLVETVANDVHFRLHLPPTLRLAAFHGEEASDRKSDVQAVHFFADTSQLFLSDVEAWQGELRPEDGFMLEIDYLHPETGEKMVEEYAFTISEALQRDHNVRKGELTMQFIDAIAEMARRPPPLRWQRRPGTWNDPPAADRCQRTAAELQTLAEGLRRDPEVDRILGLWDRYCARFEQAPAPRPGRKRG